MFMGACAPPHTQRKERFLLTILGYGLYFQGVNLVPLSHKPNVNPIYAGGQIQNIISEHMTVTPRLENTTSSLDSCSEN